MRKTSINKTFGNLIDLCIDNRLIVFDMKRQAVEEVVDVCMNGNAIQLVIRPVIEQETKKKGKKS